jgi:hypothetical protein
MRTFEREKEVECDSFALQTFYRTEINEAFRSPRLHGPVMLPTEAFKLSRDGWEEGAEQAQVSSFQYCSCCCYILEEMFGTLHNDWVRLVRRKTGAGFLPSVVAKRYEACRVRFGDRPFVTFPSAHF